MATAKPQKPTYGELAPPPDPFNPTRRAFSSTPFTHALEPTDSILQSKGGAGNLTVYKELLRDDQVSSVWQQRRLALTRCETLVEPGADDALSKAAAAELQSELEAINWDDVTDKALYALFYGWGVSEIMWRPDGNRVRFDRVIVRDRGRFRFDREGQLFLWDNGWQLMPGRKFWTVRAGADNHDELYGLGLAHSLYWPVFFKRNDIKFWLIFLEKFGMPTALAKVPAGKMASDEDRAKAVDMLRKIATDSGVVVPDDVVVELLEAARTGSSDYGAMHSAMDGAIAKIVVGQTMTTDNGSSRAQGEVHERVAQKIVEADSDLLCGSFNNGPVKWWAEWNFPGAAVPRVYRRTEPAADLNSMAERDNKIFALGYEPTEEYILETYGDGWVKKAAPMPAPDVGAFGMPTQQDQAAPPQQFAEGESLALAALRTARRGDQSAIYEAARAFANKYQTITGKRVEQLLQAAEFSEDADMFKRRLDEILSEGAPSSTVSKLMNAIASSRLLAGLRNQRQRT
jgi:phage gp29-like protein